LHQSGLLSPLLAFCLGVGKSTWFEAAATLLGSLTFQPISQDDFGGNKGAFVKGLQEILGTKSALVARTNFGPQDRKTLIDGSRRRPLLFLEPDASEDPVLVVYCALKGLVEERPDHPTLGSTRLGQALVNPWQLLCPVQTRAVLGSRRT